MCRKCISCVERRSRESERSIHHFLIKGTLEFLRTLGKAKQAAAQHGQSILGRKACKEHHHMVLLILGDGDYMLFQKHVPPKVPKARNPVQLFKKKRKIVSFKCAKFLKLRIMMCEKIIKTEASSLW